MFMLYIIPIGSNLLFHDVDLKITFCIFNYSISKNQYNIVLVFKILFRTRFYENNSSCEFDTKSKSSI